ncbi:kinase-like protein [Fistulina hepatica ATCC 64428]|uniref:Kinase-like protein n=1 Tax=Fistulina hepatica ATCC 64428 TaxID=1128425 RepID=A0A0D7AEG7_9AGAR|nr:kinase-like protein [Fistulina hepatica ATCC 64428]
MSSPNSSIPSLPDMTWGESAYPDSSQGDPASFNQEDSLFSLPSATLGMHPEKSSQHTHDATSLSLPTSFLQPGTRRLDKYTISRVLHEGITGSVYLATHSASLYAIKVLQPLSGRHDQEEIRQDLRVLSFLRAHSGETAELDHLQKMVEYFDDDDQLCIVFEYLPLTLSHSLFSGMLHLRLPALSNNLTYPSPSPSLVSAFHSGEQVSLADSLVTLSLVSSNIKAGLSFLHRSGWVHGDIKPSNLSVDFEGRVVICDFGASAQMHSHDTLTNSVIKSAFDIVSYTPLYAAPEVMMRRRLPHISEHANNQFYTVYDGRADWWSAGVVFYQLAFGVVPVSVMANTRVSPSSISTPSNPTMSSDNVLPESLSSSSLVWRTPAGNHALDFSQLDNFLKDAEKLLNDSETPDVLDVLHKLRLFCEFLRSLIKVNAGDREWPSLEIADSSNKRPFAKLFERHWGDGTGRSYYDMQSTWFPDDDWYKGTDDNETDELLQVLGHSRTHSLVSDISAYDHRTSESGLSDATSTSQHSNIYPWIPSTASLVQPVPLCNPDTDIAAVLNPRSFLDLDTTLDTLILEDLDLSASPMSVQHDTVPANCADNPSVLTSSTAAPPSLAEDEEEECVLSLDDEDILSIVRYYAYTSGLLSPTMPTPSTISFDSPTDSQSHAPPTSSDSTAGASSSSSLESPRSIVQRRIDPLDFNTEPMRLTSSFDFETGPCDLSLRLPANQQQRWSIDELITIGLLQAADMRDHLRSVGHHLPTSEEDHCSVSASSSTDDDFSLSTAARRTWIWRMWDSSRRKFGMRKNVAVLEWRHISCKLKI